MGFTLIAMSGNEYMQGNKANSTKLVLGASLLIIAAVIESYATPIILAKSINMC
ncbi:hypothetical protein [Vulcanisaeta sp. JCM 16161]|uniref:hypothetical protein n=1 Tax=Vulcanisaeta sp. JCM 16161 TaxID=1295372 RepID=UPI000AEACBD1|nr:hypothetical protein [Vulcanisaeta sp. JCM 16161]